MFVSIHPINIGKPVKIIPGLNEPSSIAFNSKGEMVVAEYYGDVVVLDKDGKKLISIKQSDHKFGNLSSVAVDNEITSILMNVGVAKTFTSLIKT